MKGCDGGYGDEYGPCVGVDGLFTFELFELFPCGVFEGAGDFSLSWSEVTDLGPLACGDGGSSLRGGGILVG
jgi:hypothetical protein